MADFKTNYDDGNVFVNKVMSHPISFLLMFGAWRAGLKGLSAMSKGGEHFEIASFDQSLRVVIGDVCLLQTFMDC